MKVKRGDGLNVVPFIDVMLVLLALVLSISTFLSQGKIKVDVPNASNTQEEKNEDNNPISIIISSENKFYISDEEVDELRLEAFIREIPNDKMITNFSKVIHELITLLLPSIKNSMAFDLLLTLMTTMCHTLMRDIETMALFKNKTFIIDDIIDTNYNRFCYILYVVLKYEY